MVKRFYFLCFFMMVVAQSFAQPRARSFSVTPQVGLTLSSLSDYKIFVGSAANGVTLTPKYKAGFVGGVSVDYQLLKQVGLSLGGYYSMQGCQFKNSSNEEPGVAGDWTGYTNRSIRLNYFQIPLMVNAYIAKNLAIKAGIEIDVLLSAKTVFDETGYTLHEDGGRTFGNTFHIVNNIEDEFEQIGYSIPVGISYEYENIVIDARYQISLNKESSRDNMRNRSFKFTVGYRLPFKR